MAVSFGVAAAERVGPDGGEGPAGEADSAMLCVFQRQLFLYQSGMHDTRSWSDVPRLDICDIPIAPGRARPKP